VRGMEDILQTPIFATSIGLLHYAKQDQVGSSASATRRPVEINQPISPEEISAPVREPREQGPGVLTRLKDWFKGNY